MQREVQHPVQVLPLMDRFMSKVRKGEGCWEWTGSLDVHGYGVLWVLGRRTVASRVSYELLRGRIGPGEFVCHACDNPPCVNPDHLWLGKQADNVADMVRKGRRAQTFKGPEGEKNWTARLNEEKVREIRGLNLRGEEALRQAAAEYGVSVSAMRAVVNGTSWRHIT